MRRTVRMDIASEFDDFVRAVWPRLNRSLVLHTGEQEAASDLAQEALARAWEQWGNIRQPEAWIFAVAFNLSRSRWRRLKLRGHVPVDEATLASSDTESAILVRNAVRRLPPRRREAVIRRYYLDQSLEAIATDMGCSIGTTKASLSQALSQLRSRIEEMSDDAALTR